METPFTFITAEQLGEMQFKYAEQWLIRHTQGDQLGTDALMLSPSFWQWWRNHWAQVDKQFRCDNFEYFSLDDKQGREVLMELYQLAHDPDILEAKLGRQIFREAYEAATAKMFKERHSDNLKTAHQ